ncbi:RND family efflux transporter MFP subunit [Neorhizobium sp. R1-B]|uniref:efflux RND transporter periplasmic adaptor subunit n=1 Tax=unclassified Neorhizobium TaxID=2629175 RepID=UPI001044F18E|nr:MULTISPECIES: efflux RND transporter periplasmic adaptor subunit [unclassified Neorhizobium]TCV70046.1 RND family efflux transporter MFP subunit [Neorhizobium sp. S3-V5DH]TDX80388.1 RND family efflux transporter MFP subunit [Neorhizobium sp. R1-B]
MCRSTTVFAILPLLCMLNGIAAAQEVQRKVVAQSPTRQQVTRYLHSTGTLKAVNAVDLVARVSGTLEKINFEDGARVRKNDIVFVVEQEPYRIGLASAEAELAQAQANLQQSDANLIRQEALSKQQVTAQAARESAVAQNEIAKAQVAAAEAKVRSAQLNLSYTEIQAPFDGILAARATDIGAYVNAASAPKLAALVQPDPMHVLFSANERQVIEIRKALAERNMTIGDLSKIRVEFGLQAEEGYPHSGKLDYISPEIDPASGTMTVRGIIDNRDYLFSSGMFAKVRIPLATHTASVVPETAVGNSQQGRTVLVVNADNRVELRKVVVGENAGAGSREIVEGLSDKDRVIVQGAAGVRPGETVTVVEKLQ